MAPVDPEFFNSNVRPVALFASQALSVIALTTFVLRHLQRADRSIPPSLDTRSRRASTRRNIKLFTTLAALSFVIATYHAISKRFVSYQIWAHEHNERIPTSIWDGWFAKDNHETTSNTLLGDYMKPHVERGLQLGRWLQNTDLSKQFDCFAIGISRGFWWTQAHFVGLIVWSVFLGIESRHRNVPNTVVAALILLARLVGLSFAQNLFNIMLLLTPVSLPGSSASYSRQPSPLWTPFPAVYIIPALLSLVGLAFLPAMIGHASHNLLRAAYTLIPLFLAIGHQFVPRRLGQIHRDMHAARRPYSRVFNAFAASSFALHAFQTLVALFRNAPDNHYHRYNFIWNTHAEEKRSLFDMTRVAVARLLGSLGEHPVVSAFGWDVLLSGLTLCTLAAVRSLDINAILKCSVAPWLGKKGEKYSKDNKANKEGDTIHVKAPAPTFQPTSPVKRGRGRPKKSDDHAEASMANLQLRRSSRRLQDVQPDDDDNDEDYVPPPTTRAQAAQMVHGEEGNDDLVEDAEAGAVTWGLFVLGGLGAASCGALGAEVCGK